MQQEDWEVAGCSGNYGYVSPELLFVDFLCFSKLVTE